MKIHFSAGKPERRQVSWIWSGDIPLLYKFSEFFMFKPAQHWVEKALELPDRGILSETPTLSPLLNKVEMMEKGNLYLSLSILVF